jgi:hypothetical protein
VRGLGEGQEPGLQAPLAPEDALEELSQLIAALLALELLPVLDPGDLDNPPLAGEGTMAVPAPIGAEEPE